MKGRTLGVSAFLVALTAVTFAQFLDPARDADNDGLSDAWELAFGLDPNSAAGNDGAAGDPDGDGRTNLQEQQAGTHPRGFHTRYFAHGETGQSVDTRIAIANPGARPAAVLLTFARSDGEHVTRRLRVEPTSRATVTPASIPGLEAAEFSTTVESDEQVAVDESMSLDGNGYASQAETSVSGPSTTWLFAEAATQPGFNVVYVITNPASTAADVQVRYLRAVPASPLSKTYRVAARSRVSVSVDAEAKADASLSALASTDVSAVMTSTVPVIIERAITLDGATQSSTERHAAVGVTAPAMTWYFAEGATGSFFDMFLSMVNPNRDAADVEARYLLPSGEIITKQHSVAGNSRFNVWVDIEDPRLADTPVSVIVKSTNGVAIVAERSISWPGATGAASQELHVTAGATATATRWAFAEGELGGSAGTETYVAIANTSATAGFVKVTLFFEDGTTAEKIYTLLATSRFSTNLAREFPAAAGKRFGALVESQGDPAAELVVERSMYSNPLGRGWVAGSTVLATPLPLAGVDESVSRAQSLQANAISTETGALAAQEISAPAGSTAGAAAYNLKVVSDASPDLSDMVSLISSITSRWTSAREKVWSLFYWSRILKRQTTPMVLHGFDVTDPIRNFSDYGFTMCSTISGINQSLYEGIGLRHQYWDICNHTVTQVEYDAKFHMIDSSMSNLVTNDDGVTLASLPEAAADSARLVRERSVHSTSPNGFLTGSDTSRNLTDFSNPATGSVIPGFSGDFCENGLKFRDYFYNWNSGHRYVLNLREDESYTRYYRGLGTTADYWVPSEKISAPDPADTIEIEPSNRFRIRGNGTWSFAPRVSSDAWARAVYSANNITAAAGGLEPAVAGQPSEVVYKVQAANAITSQKIHAQFSRADALASASISVSINHGLTWTPPVSLGSTVGTAMPLDLNLRTEVSGAYETLVRIQMSVNSASPSGVVLTGLTIDTLTQVNTKALPKLNVGRNEIFVGQGDRSDTMVLWPDLRSDLWKKDAVDSKNIASQGVNVSRPYTAVVYPAVLNQDASLTYRMEAPADITRLVYGGRLHNFAAGSYIDFLHSFDGGATWIRSYRLSDISKPYDVIHYETVTGIPAGVKTVLFKFLMHNTNTTVLRATGLYAVRMEANHRPLNEATKPIDVTLRWKEVRSDRSLVERSHKQKVNAFPVKYVVNVGGSDHPIMESLKVNLENTSDTTPYGYSDGTDTGGQKYVHTKRTEGTNRAEGQPYSISRAPSGFQGSPGVSNTTILTDGVVGAPATGSTTYLWGQCWSSGQDVDLQVDLGAARTVGVFRAHLFGYPSWDALQGQVQDRVEVLTSLDGVNFASRGLLDTALWRKDIPINHLLPEDEKATAWNFERKVSPSVSARYVKYHATPKRTLCVSELQVLDRVDYAPFDIGIALPVGGSSGDTTPPTGVVVTAPVAGQTVSGSVTLQGNATDNVGVTLVEFLVNGTVVGSDTTAPYTVSWNSTAVANGNATVAVRASDAAGNKVTSPAVTISVANASSGQSKPFTGTPVPLPAARVEFENYDTGGSAIAYLDTTSGNSGSVYRSDNVDIQATTDSGGGYNLAWVKATEWVNYTVALGTSGSYTVGVRVASNGTGGTLHIEVDGTDKTGPIAVPNTGGWQTWTTITKTGVLLPAGTHILRVVMDTNGATGSVGNLNWFAVTTEPPPSAGSKPFTGTPVALPGKVELENYDTGGSGIAFLDTTTGNTGSVYRSDNVDIQATTDSGGGYNLAWVRGTEWLNYTVTIGTSSNYTVDVRLASNGTGGTFHIEVDGTDKTGPITVPNTGGWQTWTTLTKTGVSLSAGTQIVRVVMDANGATGSVGNFNWFAVR